MESAFDYPFRVHPCDADGGGRLKASSLFNGIQNIASMHSDKMGVGFHDVVNQGMFWVLSWASLEFSFFPFLGDELSGRTWPKCAHKLFSMRDFLFADAKGDVFCRASTAWMLIDAIAKKAVNLSRLKGNIAYQEHESALSRLPEKLSFPDGCRSVCTRRVRYSDLDVNRHVNNARHVEYLMDCYGIEHHKTWQVRSLTVSFVSEARYDEEICFRLTDGPRHGSTHLIEARKVATDTPVVQAAIEWMPLKR